MFHDFFSSELITVKLPAGSNFDRDVISHFGDTIIGLKKERQFSVQTLFFKTVLMCNIMSYHVVTVCNGDVVIAVFVHSVRHRSQLLVRSFRV
jgi:hypothetical protein